MLKLEKIGQIVEATRKELHGYWDACYYSQEQRDKFGPIHSGDYTEELLEEHEREIARIKAYYDANYDMFKLVRKRQELWSKMLELEERKKDPTHLFKAKGPALLIEERERKRVSKNLPKVDAELQQAMAEYQEKNGEPFLVGGQPYDEFIERQEVEYQREREMESEMKRREKKAEIEQETIYGISRPVTPAKLRANLTSAAAAANATASLKRKVPGGGGPPTPGGANMAKRMHMAPGSATLGGAQSSNKRNITAVGGSAQTRSKALLLNCGFEML